MILSVDWNHRGHIGTAFGSSEIGIGNAAVLHWMATPERTVRRIASTTATVRVSPLSRCSLFTDLFICAKHLLVAAMNGKKKSRPRSRGVRRVELNRCWASPQTRVFRAFRGAKREGFGMRFTLWIIIILM